MIPRYNTAVKDDANNLTSAYKNAPNVQAILAAFLKQAQYLETAQFNTLQSRLIGISQAWVLPVGTPVPADNADLTNAELITVVLDAANTQLDTIGKIVGELRLGRGDAEYLVAIRTRILVNRSNGLSEDVLRVSKQALPLGVTRTYSEPAPATWLVETYNFAYALTLRRLLGGVRSGGVRGLLQYSSRPLLTETFRFASFYGSSAGDTRGLESVISSPRVARLVGVLDCAT